MQLVVRHEGPLLLKPPGVDKTLFPGFRTVATTVYDLDFITSL
ncbi:hypothetical protein E2C01_078804 [Portunus trituberculatus]|uniref:Uncharacterized protein n=1 Tax=Portunus trituberculatus TaxID=210409 RepID=A0A5B7ITS5_PORTR|nr:hypothetical protein [Portunus trituberculatus]